MDNKPYLRTILGDTEFKSFSLIPKCVCIIVVLLWLSKLHVIKVWSSWTCSKHSKLS